MWFVSWGYYRGKEAGVSLNFYKHHLGDYDGATAHLSWDEDMAYTRLLRAYYRREKPLADTAEACRLVRATTRVQRGAVETVLAEFFTEEEDGWHNKRADIEIEAYQAQASTNKRIAQQRIVKRIVNEPSTNGSPEYCAEREPNQEPLTKNQNQEPENTNTAASGSLSVVRKKEKKSSIPEAFGSPFTPLMQEWLERRGETQVKAHLIYFVGYVKANGKQYADWEQAFQNAIRDDWAGVRRLAS